MSKLSNGAIPPYNGRSPLSGLSQGAAPGGLQAMGGNTGISAPSMPPMAPQQSSAGQSSMTPFGPGGLRGLVDQGQQLAAQMRQGHGYQGAQQGPAMPPGGPQGQAGMGGQPGAPSGGFTTPQQFPPVAGTQAYVPSAQQGGGIPALIDQLRQQQPARSQAQ